MEELVMTEDSHFRIDSLKNGIDWQEPVGHPFVMKIIELEAALKNRPP